MKPSITVRQLITRLQALVLADAAVAAAAVALYDWYEQYAQPSEAAAAAPLEVWGDAQSGYTVVLGIPQGDNNLARLLRKAREACQDVL